MIFNSTHLEDAYVVELARPVTVRSAPSAGGGTRRRVAISVRVGMVQNAGDWWLERQTMSRENLSDYLATIIWHAIDGLLRSAGVQVDPARPLTPLRLVD